jgi:hypothetical protein
MADGMPAQRVVGFSQFRISSRVSADLIEIWTFIADDSVTNAHAFIDKLYETIQVLGRQSGWGFTEKSWLPGVKALGRIWVAHPLWFGFSKIQGCGLEPTSWWPRPVGWSRLGLRSQMIEQTMPIGASYYRARCYVPST